jgi:ATP phosphoribosyltransferase
LLDAIDGVLGAVGWLHLEVVGSQAAAGAETAALVVNQLREHGAAHLARGEVWNDSGVLGWRVTALLPAGKLPICRRALFRLGASRVVALPPRSLFDRDGPSTFDALCRRFEATGGDGSPASNRADQGIGNTSS